MDPPPFDSTPLIDLEDDRSGTSSSSGSGSGSDSDSDDQPQTQEQNTFQAPLTSPPTRSIRELVESLGSPLGSSTSSHSRTRQSAAPASPSPFDDPVPFRDELNRGSTGFRTLLEQDLTHARPTHTEFIPFIEEGDLPEQDHTSLNAPQPTPWAPQLPHPVIPTWLNPPTHNEAPLELNPSTHFGASLDQTLLRTRPENTAFGPSFAVEPEHTSLNIPRERPSRRTPWVSRPIAPAWLNRYSPPLTRPSAHTYSTRPTNIPPPAYPWNHSNAHDAFDRPDVFSRTTAHTTISDILFNFDLDGSTMSELLADACETARQVGVSTHELLSRTVFLGTTDLGISPLCLEASRVDVEGDGGMELVWWLIENTRPSEVYNEVRKGCLMRRGGEGEQSVWNVLRGLVPDPQGKRVAYDVQVQGLAIVPAGLCQIEDEDEDDEGSLYEDIEIIDAESGFLDQADIETLKSSSDEAEREDPRAGPDPEPIARPAPAQVHRARIIMPSVNEHLTRNERLTAEWIHQGRLWALSITQDTLVLRLRQTSALVSAQPIYVRALVRLVPLDLAWTALPEPVRIGPDRILPTQVPSEDLLSSPLYECELDERVIIPGVSGTARQSSLWRSGIRVSMFSLWELVGPLGGFKLEVVVRTSEEETERDVPIQVESDVGDWQRRIQLGYTDNGDPDGGDSLGDAEPRDKRRHRPKRAQFDFISHGSTPALHLASSTPIQLQTMMLTVESLEPHILSIFTSPTVDLNKITAKQVRAQLRATVPGVQDDWVREHKAEIDALTAAVFDRVRPGEESGQETSTPPAPETNNNNHNNKRKRTAEEEADAEYARKLASELNGHNTRAGSVGKKPSKTRRKVKSAEEIEESDEDQPKKKSKPRKSKKQDEGDGETKKRGGYQKEYALSPALAAFTGTPALSRPQIVKKLWDHIKANSLQNPQDKREILCDEQMKSLFGVDKINMFQMNKVIGVHIIPDPQ